MKTKTIFTAVAFTLALAVPAFAADHAVAIKSFKFDPPMISVAPGDTVTFTNMDGAPHTATAMNGAFDTGRLNKGKSATVTIKSAGSIDYKCNFHPAMKGKVAAK